MTSLNEISRLNSVLCRSIKKNLKEKIVISNIIMESILLYIAELSTINKAIRRKIFATEMDYWRGS